MDYNSILFYIYTYNYLYSYLYSYLCSHHNTSLLHATCWICLRLLTPIIWEFFGLTTTTYHVNIRSVIPVAACWATEYTHIPSVSRGDWRTHSTTTEYY